MKIKTLLFIAFFSFISMNIAKTLKKKLKEPSTTEKGYETPEIRGSAKTSRAQHVGGMMLPLPPAGRDRSPLWKDFSKPGFERPFMHGVVGPQWSVPGAEVTDGFDIIGSPMPKPDLSSRIVAHDMPDKTYTGTSFDNPKRKDVIQASLPTMTTRTVEESSDPRNAPKKPVQMVKGTVYHATGSVDPKVVFGSHHSFIEKAGAKSKKTASKSKKTASKSKKSKKDIHQEARSLRVDGLHHAKEAYSRAGTMLGAITTGSRIILDAKTTNKQEHPEIKQYENNKYLHDRVAGMRRTPHGVKAAHTLRRMG